MSGVFIPPITISAFTHAILPSTVTLRPTLRRRGRMWQKPSPSLE